MRIYILDSRGLDCFGLFTKALAMTIGGDSAWIASLFSLRSNCLAMTINSRESIAINPLINLIAQIKL